MVAYAFDIINKFFCNILFKFFCQIINRTGKHEIFPYNKPQLVTGIPKAIVGIITPAPHADTVEMGVPGLF